MKRKDVIKILEDNGYSLKRSGGNHDIYWNAEFKRTIPVKRHSEIPDVQAAAIFKEAGIKR